VLELVSDWSRTRGNRFWGPVCLSGCAGTGFVTYGLTGFFGAAMYGADTKPNVLENSWGGNFLQGILNVAMSRAPWLEQKPRNNLTKQMKRLQSL
jgi:hypothetical protein